MTDNIPQPRILPRNAHGFSMLDYEYMRKHKVDIDPLYPRNGKVACLDDASDELLMSLFYETRRRSGKFRVMNLTCQGIVISKVSPETAARHYRLAQIVRVFTITAILASIPIRIFVPIIPHIALTTIAYACAAASLTSLFLRGWFLRRYLGALACAVSREKRYSLQRAIEQTFTTPSS